MTNIPDVIRNLAHLIAEADGLPEEGPCSKDHLYEMAGKLVSHEVSGDKAHRWLGWFQCCLVIGGATTFEEMKEINKYTLKTGVDTEFLDRKPSIP